MLTLGLLAALSTAVLFTVSQLIAKKVTPVLGMRKTSLIVVGVGIIPMLIAFVLLPVPELSTVQLLTVVLGGVFLGLGYFGYYKSVESQQISNVAGVDLIQPVAIAIFGIFFLGESINAPQFVGALAVFIGILFISTHKEGRKPNWSLLPALLGNVSWAIYWIILSPIIIKTNQFALPLLLSRTVATIVAVLGFFLMFGKVKQKKTARAGGSLKRLLLFIVVLGIIEALFDSSGNITFGVAVVSNYLALGAVITCLCPVMIALCAHFIYRERLTLIQACGIVLATLGALAIAMF